MIFPLHYIPVSTKNLNRQVLFYSNKSGVTRNPRLMLFDKNDNELCVIWSVQQAWTGHLQVFCPCT